MVSISRLLSDASMNPDERVYERAETVSKLQREASHAVSIPPDAPVESLVTQFESRDGRKELRFKEFREQSLVSCKATKDGREERSSESTSSHLLVWPKPRMFQDRKEKVLIIQEQGDTKIRNNT